MIRIALFAYSFSPNLGGGEEYNFNLAHSLSQKGVNVHVVTPVRSEKPDNYDFTVRRIRNGFISSVFDLYSEVKRIKPDLLHISGPTPIDLIISPLVRMLGIPVIMTYHADFPSRRGRILSTLFPLVQRCVDRILVQTERDRRKLTKRLVSKERIEKFCFSGIDQRIFRIMNDSGSRDIDILFVGRMDRAHSYKGYWEMLQILTELKKTSCLPDSIYVVGGGEDMKEFLERSRSNELNIKAIRDITKDELVRIFNRSKTLLLPSTSPAEGFGRVSLEAIFCGAVPIVSKYAGSAEIIEEYNAGYVIDPKDTVDSARKICELLSDPYRLSTYRANGLKMIESGKFTVDWTSEKTLKIYYQIIGRKTTKV
ncbi:MAG: glycosyltransferase family 4 protein [Nitrososphaerota archaeon]